MSATAPTPEEPKPPVLNFLNVLVLLGILVVVVGVTYFATTFVQELSEYGKLSILLLSCIMFVSLGVGFEGEHSAGALVNRRGFRWLRVQTAFFLLGGVAGLVSAFFFVSMDEVDTRVKIIVTILAGLALIGVAAWLQQRRLREGASR